MGKYIYLSPGQKNPKLMVEGQMKERIKAERPGEAHGRYLEMLKEKAKIVKPRVEEKKPRKLKAEFPVSNLEPKREED